MKKLKKFNQYMIESIDNNIIDMSNISFKQHNVKDIYLGSEGVTRMPRNPKDFDDYEVAEIERFSNKNDNKKLTINYSLGNRIIVFNSLFTLFIQKMKDGYYITLTDKSYTESLYSKVDFIMKCSFDDLLKYIKYTELLFDKAETICDINKIGDRKKAEKIVKDKLQLLSDLCDCILKYLSGASTGADKKWLEVNLNIKIK